MGRGQTSELQSKASTWHCSLQLHRPLLSTQTTHTHTPHSKHSVTTGLDQHFRYLTSQQHTSSVLSLTQMGFYWEMWHPTVLKWDTTTPHPESILLLILVSILKVVPFIIINMTFRKAQSQSLTLCLLGIKLPVRLQNTWAFYFCVFIKFVLRKINLVSSLSPSFPPFHQETKDIPHSLCVSWWKSGARVHPWSDGGVYENEGFRGFWSCCRRTVSVNGAGGLGVKLSLLYILSPLEQRVERKGMYGGGG